jgi:Ferritin-like
VTTMYALEKAQFGPPKDIEALRGYLQAALEVEHLTIPVYMTGMYSIKAGTNAFAYEVIRSVLLEEMLHMTLAANLLNAVDCEPDTKKFVRKYPAKLPFSDASLPKIHLRHYSPEALETFKLIERPRSFVPPTPNAKGWTSIGQFYHAIRQGVITLEDAAQATGGTIFTGDPKRQIGPEDFYNSGGEAFAVTDLKSALLAIEVISEQGEGAHDTIWDSDDKIFGEERQVAHYFRFNEIAAGRRYGKHDLPRSAPSGPLLDITWDNAYPIDPEALVATYPHSEVREQAIAFNATYAELVVLLRKAFTQDPRAMHRAVPVMLVLRDLSQRLYRNPHPDPDKARQGLHASPTFELSDHDLEDAEQRVANIRSGLTRP